jgi:PAS domain S-box-containing protein
MAEQELRNSERKYRSLFDQSLDGILLACVGADGEILAANPAACRKLGCTEAEIIRRGKRAFMEPDDPAYSGQPTSYHGEYRYRNANGHWFPVEVAGGVFPGRDGRLWIGVTFRDITKRKQSEAELTRSREELRSLSGSLQTVQEAERRRIARELHDELGQCLMALKLDVSWLRDRLPAEAAASLGDKLDQIANAIDATVEAVRSLAANLRPSILDDLGLTAACEWLLQEFRQRTGIDCHLRVEPTEEFALPDDVATAAFRVVQEALTNVARHAQAQRVDVHLLRGPDGLKVVIADDGVGLPQNRSRVTLGLVGMRERALALGGSLDLHSGPGEGTRIHLFIPIATEPHGRTESND